LAQPEAALAFSKSGPSQSRHTWLGPGLAWPKPRLYAKKISITRKQSITGTSLPFFFANTSHHDIH
jgi:hypothetical protein